MKYFLNITDDTLAPFISDIEYDRSLVHHILFQESALVEEGYLGDSSRTFAHIVRARKLNRDSLFIESLRRGIVVPVLRELGPNPIDRLFERWTNRYSRTYPILRPENATLKHLISDALKQHLEAGSTPMVWPDSSGKSIEEEYEQLLRESLQREPTGLEQAEQGFQEVWSATEEWRISGLEEAASRTAQAGGRGISRTQIVNIVGESWQIPATPYGSQITEILRSSNRDRATIAFLRWSTQLHHLSRARFFETAIHFPVYDLDRDFVAGALLRRARVDQLQHMRAFSVEVELPPPEKLALVEPLKLLTIRDTYGRPYFLALREWAYSPNAYTQKSVQYALRDYADSLSRFFPPESLYKVELSETKPRQLLSEGTAANIANDLSQVGFVHTGVPFATLIQAVGSLWVHGKWWLRKSRYTHKPQIVDVTLPETTA